jgi:hypothetical protein
VKYPFYFWVSFKTNQMKDKLINWFQDVTVWLAWYLIVSTVLLAIFIVPSYIAQVLCK